MTPTPPPPPALSRARLWLFRLLALSLPLLAFALLEIALRLFGWGGYPAFLRSAGTLPDGVEVCLVEPAASKPYFYANPTRPGYADQTTFLMPKPADLTRIFLVGESAAKGYPQPRNLAASAFLEKILSTAQPDRSFEIINLGTTAVASFPLVYQVRDALRYSPDLFVLYVGNNEFFGAYGTGSINAAGTLPPVAQRAQRTLRGLATTQALGSLLYKRADLDRSLMEEMIGRTFIAADSPLRAAAARNLRVNLATILSDIRRAGVPVLVCTTASNEAGLAPLGADDLSGLDEPAKSRHGELLAGAEAHLRAGRAAEAVAPLRAASELAPRSARSAFLLGRALAASGNPAGARAAFLQARDLDTMPWRPTSQTERAIRDAASAAGAPLCDLAALFREQSPSGATDWDLLDDHVHLSLDGQARAARAIAAALSAPLRLDPDALARVPPDSELAAGLGANTYDSYRVNHTLRVLFGIPFMRESNPEAYQRFHDAVVEAEARMAPAVLEAARRWQTATPHAGGLRPITGMVARVLIAQGRHREALELYTIARDQVPDHTSWFLEYVYFRLACLERLHGSLDEAARGEAGAAIRQGRFLLARGFSRTGLAERHLGRLHQLLGEWGEAIPLLLAARPRLQAEDRVACDQALVLSYLKTGDKAAALALAEQGERDAGRFTDIYRGLRREILRQSP